MKIIDVLKGVAIASIITGFLYVAGYVFEGNISTWDGNFKAAIEFFSFMSLIVGIALAENRELSDW